MLTAVGITFGSLVIAYAEVKGHAKLAFMTAVLLPAVVFVLARPWRAFGLSLVLLIVVPFTWSFVAPQLSIERICALFVIAALVLDASQTRDRAKLGVVDLAVGGFALFGFVSWQLNPALHGFRAALAYLLPLTFYLAGRMLVSTRVREVQWLLLASGTIASLTLYYEFFVTRSPLFVDPATYGWSSPDGTFIFRPGGVFESPPAAGAILSMIILFSLPLVRSSSGRAKHAAIACLLVCGGGVVIPFYRAAQIGLLAGLALYIILSRPAHWGRIVFLTAAFGMVVVLLALPRLEHASWFQQGVLRRGTFATRQAFWSAARPVITNSASHFVLGHGVNSLLVARGELPGTPAPDIANVRTLVTNSPHSQYVRTLIEEGVIGVGLLAAWLLGAVGRGARAAWRESHLDRLNIAAGAAAIFSVFITCFDTDALRQPTTMALVSLLTGSVVALGASRAHSSSPDAHGPVAAGTRDVPPLSRAGA